MTDELEIMWNGAVRANYTNEIGRRLTDGNEEDQDKYNSVSQSVSVLRARFEPGITLKI